MINSHTARKITQNYPYVNISVSWYM